MAEVNRGMGVITETDCYLFGQGTHYEIYKKLGAHPMTWKGITLRSGHRTRAR